MTMDKEFNEGLVPEVYNHEINADHGRMETRQVKTLPVHTIDNQLDLSKWANIQSIVEVTYKTDDSTEKRYFISTLNHKDVERIARSIRSHWQIENNLHWVLDVVFREDESRIRDERTALNFAWFRKMAIGLLAKDGTTLSNKRKMLRNCINPEHIIKGLMA
jgi:predicted transposase YbfD/YdcC